MTETPMERRCAVYRDKLKGEPFASIVPSRSPELKYHGSIGRAKSAVAYTERIYDQEQRRTYDGARGGEIYRRTADGWELAYRVEKGTLVSELPWKVAKQ
ncbi:hypothetical protein [Streptomyces sp. DH10]|uniref:hypothetical protein n=1 Tax=Streptomyces sp. DH10 TaxID=3040121 RepID=UPI002440FFC0|nr:hypothetical protein [Streptomyces sp. DH10]MDG9711139.1 hypothetical protein [Streptomyces sp. DH10]